MRHRRSRLIWHLRCFADDLEAGRPCQITRLMPVVRLADKEYRCQALSRHLVERSRELFLAVAPDALDPLV